MRELLSAFCVATIVIAAAPSGVAAQSIVDLSKPQIGKARFVLNPDLTPADLGAAEEKSAPALAAARIPACGEGCTMQQPELPREHRYRDGRDPNSYRTRGGTRIIFIGNVGSGPKAAQANTAPAPRRSFRFRRR